MFVLFQMTFKMWTNVRKRAIELIKIERIEEYGIEAAIRGMRNPMNSWDRSDSFYCKSSDGCDEKCRHARFDDECYKHRIGEYMIGPNDEDLMLRLDRFGPVHRKYMRMMIVTMDITAPLYWWKEFDTYKVGTVANSCSTMHKIHAKEFALDDFSFEHISDVGVIQDDEGLKWSTLQVLEFTIHSMNVLRELCLKTKDKRYWWQMIQLLPSSYNQKRTVQLNYEVLSNILEWRKDHKLDEWREFCQTMLDSLKYSFLLTDTKDDTNDVQREHTGRHGE